jgi:hypothetical protein
MQEIHANREWERRFRLPMVLATQIARLRPECGLALAVTGGSYQLHAWHVPEGRLAQLTFGSANVQRGYLPRMDSTSTSCTMRREGSVDTTRGCRLPVELPRISPPTFPPMHRSCSHRVATAPRSPMWR